MARSVRAGWRYDIGAWLSPRESPSCTTPRRHRRRAPQTCPTGAARGPAPTGGFFEATPEQALEPPPPANSPRRIPPYTPKFQAIYEENLQRVAADRFPDPISICGTPAGWPRMLQLPDAYEFVIRPEQTWLLSENGPNTVRIYTDGRKHPAA